MFFKDFAITIENISLIYEIYDKPIDQLKQFLFPRLLRTFGIKSDEYFRTHTAIDNVTIKIHKGETIGIIGKNGSGKSTLLQLVCGILSPQDGMIKINGKLAAILELGAGFNPEFTGRENVYMNAELLGLNKSQIDQRFQQIANFADIGSYIDQPVKFYSSGMYVRLAFAIIAHVDADILIIDEALAVGDAIFTQKCMRFIRSFKQNGTILFVSHDISSVKNLCTRAIWIDGGKIKLDGNVTEVCDAYMQDSLQHLYGDSVTLNPLKEKPTLSVDEKLSDERKEVIIYKSTAELKNNMHISDGWTTGAVTISSVKIERIDGTDTEIFSGGDEVELTIVAKCNETLDRPILGFILKDRLGQELFGENTFYVTKGKECIALNGQELEAKFIFRLPMLQDGNYSIMASFASGDPYNHIHHHYIHDALILQVHSSNIRFGIVGIPFDSVSLNIYRNQESIMSFRL